jgi:tetratricopeptide (TPR) repeat protein
MAFILWSIFVVMITWTAWAPFWRTPLFQDQSLHLYIGRHWLKGKLPYRDYSMGPGPHLGLIYTLLSVLCGQNEFLIQFFSATYIAVGNLFLFWTVKTFYGSAAAVFTSLFFAFYIFNPRLLGDRMTPETYATPPIVIAYSCLLASFGGGGWPYAFAAGFFLGVAALFRQSAYAYLFPLFGALTYYESWKDVLSAGGGFVLIHLFWIAYFCSKGAAKDYLRSTIWFAVRTAFFKSIKGPGQTESDPMKASYKQMFKLLKSNSLTIFPLYMLALSGLGYAVISGATPYTVTTGLFWITGVGLIFPRWNFDCCYWLNSVPWAAALAGMIGGRLVERMAGEILPEHIVILTLTFGFLFYIYLFDSPMYLATDPLKRNALIDPKKMSHASWWTTYNMIGAYLKEQTRESDKVLVLGHAARILNKAEREAFFYSPSFVLFKMKPFDVEENRRFREIIQKDYPDVIVLAGHMPAYPFNPRPYLQDLGEIGEITGIVYTEKKVIDHFPIYMADIEKSYIKALIRNNFKNQRLRSERDRISAETLQFEDNRLSGNARTALHGYLNALENAERYEDMICVVLEVVNLKIFASEPAFLHNLLVILGEAQYRKGDEADAEKTFKAILDAFPQSAPSYNNLGAMSFARGKREEARAMFQKALEVDPDNADGRANLTALRSMSETTIKSNT